jgi:hypothetical protein
MMKKSFKKPQFVLVYQERVIAARQEKKKVIVMKFYCHILIICFELLNRLYQSIYTYIYFINKSAL